MEMFLHKFTASALIFMLDGFSGYNQFLMEEEDRTKNTFVTLYGPYVYVTNSFRLKNASETF
jgi:hypothetical protein